MTHNEHLELGLINTLLLDRLTAPGAYLVAQDGKDVLLPGQYLTETMREGDLLDVFLYTDSEDRLVATTLTPKIKLDEFGLLEVVDTTKIGAFLDWGLSKDLFVPNMLQKSPFQVGEKRFVRVVYDERTHRLVGSEKLGNFFEKRVRGINKGSEVDILIIAKTPLGYKCVVNNKYEGLIYHNEIFEKISLGDSKKAYVKLIRKDGNIDLNLRKSGSKNSSNASERVLTLLKEHRGVMPYNYKSDATLISDVFAMSKKEFKRSLTKLQDSGDIEVKESGIYLMER